MLNGKSFSQTLDRVHFILHLTLKNLRPWVIPTRTHQRDLCYYLLANFHSWRAAQWRHAKLFLFVLLQFYETNLSNYEKMMIIRIQKTNERTQRWKKTKMQINIRTYYRALSKPGRYLLWGRYNFFGRHVGLAVEFGMLWEVIFLSVQRI